MNKVIEWLMQNKKRHYKVVYIATGYMSNKYDAGIFEFYVSDKEIKKGNFSSPMQYGFYKYYGQLSRHFKAVGAVHIYSAAYIRNNLTTRIKNE